MSQNHEHWMRVAIAEADLARGATGDNPWVGCVITSADGHLIGKGHTQGPGEAHAEIAAAQNAKESGHSIVGATLYSTLEPCAFHGRTPACSRSIAERGIAQVFLGMRDPHPRVNGAGIQILADAGVQVTESVCEAEVRAQLGVWVLQYHPQDILARAGEIVAAERNLVLAEMYGVSTDQIGALLAADL